MEEHNGGKKKRVQNAEEKQAGRTIQKNSEMFYVTRLINLLQPFLKFYVAVLLLSLYDYDCLSIANILFLIIIIVFNTMVMYNLFLKNN